MTSINMKQLFFLIFSTLTCCTLPAQAQETATGTVFLDENNNGRMDPSEEGIPEVSVSNGREVVLTDDEGRYSLDIGKMEGNIFVIKPSGYRLPTDEQNHPKFYYLHKPEGSPELNYDGVEPTGPLPESVNFPLLKGEKDNQFSVLLFGDPQPYTKKEVEYFDRDIVAELQDVTSYDFGITLGDLVGRDMDLYPLYSKSVAKIGIPWFNVYGNNDINLDAETDRHADETFEATFGPATYSFNHGKAHFIILDDMIYPTEDDARMHYTLTRDQLLFVKNDLEHVSKDRLVVLAFHVPLFGSFKENSRRQLFSLLKDYSHTLSLSGHTHTQQIHFFGPEQGWQRITPHMHYNVGASGGSWWSGILGEDGIPPALMADGTPNGYAMLNVDGNTFTIDYKVAGKPADFKMSIWGPDVVAQNSWPTPQFYVNYFLGSEYTTVEYKLQDHEQWRPMSKVSERDPHAIELQYEWDNSKTLPKGKRPANPEKSTHLWKTWVPNDLSLGEYTVEIRVTDMFGRTFTDEFNYEVVEPK
ncbi:Calcineurin-like phosphoesterase [Fodinibius salinus]|uniref:Calcineurin-like phosphoesterase n=2 Tax=Fodinibius salinus TaxID=860790 RepID=A0A5D3YHI4_9BACT|nr:Calcineurin-like phosphoesterase [Fodinibius salinus]